MNKNNTDETIEEIYRETSGFVFRNALRLTGSVSDAEDITQEVFIKVFKNLGKFRGNSDIKTWLYRITINTAHNYIRAMKGRTKIEEYNSFDGELPEMSNSPEEKFNIIELKDFIQKTINKLPEELRECLYLREIEDMKYEDIAELMKENVNTIKTRIRRARERLADIMKGVEI